MADEYIWQNENNIAVINGKRSGENRRKTRERRNQHPAKMFVCLLLNQREGQRRTGPVDRRHQKEENLNDQIKRLAGSVSIGMALIILGIVSIVTGFTFFPVLGHAMGAVMILGGLFFIFSPA